MPNANRMGASNPEFAGFEESARIEKPNSPDYKIISERLLLAIRGSGDGVWAWSIEHRSLYLSDRFKALVDFPFDLDVPFLDALIGITHIDDLQATLQVVQRHLAGQGELNHECRLRTPQKEYRWFLLMGQAEWDQAGAPLRMAGLLADITKRKKMEDDLRLSEQNLRKAQELAHIGSWLFTPSTQHLHWSDELFRIFEISPETPADQLYATYRASFHPDDLFLLDDSIEKGMSYLFEHRIICPGGRIKHILSTGNFVYDENRALKWMQGTAQDISSRKKAEMDRQEYLEMLEELLFSLSHKIRKPVANIQAIVHILNTDTNISELELKQCLGYLNSSNLELDACIHEMNNLIADKKRNL
ncbi:MAG: PAS domain-containing protein [Bacteroidetes bacterium]|nr:PAS domain-containing protein [Bacteroidota bacterium]